MWSTDNIGNYMYQSVTDTKLKLFFLQFCDAKHLGKIRMGSPSPPKWVPNTGGVS